MERILKINGRSQTLDEPYCGAITYCAISGTDPKEVSKLHDKASLKPSLGIFYLSFLKLDPFAVVFVEDNEGKGLMIDSSDIDCFDTMWKFEESLQRMSKDEFVKKVVENNMALFEKYERRINRVAGLNFDKFKKILIKFLEQKFAIGVMIMDDLHAYTGKSGQFLLPHWVTVHGCRDGAFLVFNSYRNTSEWIKDSDFFNSAVNLVRDFHFAPQMVIVGKELPEKV